MTDGGLTEDSGEQLIGGDTRPKTCKALHQTPWTFILLVALVTVVSVALRVGNLDAFSLSNDEGAYLMWAWLVHSGYPLYSETVSVSAPFFIVALDWAFDLAGVSLIAGRALVLGFFSLALFSLAWAGQQLHHWLTGAAAALAFALAPLAFILSRMALGEIPSAALATFSVASALAFRQRGGWVWVALSGLAYSLSLLAKAMNPLAILPVLWLIITRQTASQAGWSRVVAPLATWGAVALLPVVVCLLIYDPAAFYDQAIAFRLELRETFPWLPANNMSRLYGFVQQQWGIVGLALVGIVFLLRKARWQSLIPVLLWLAGSLLSAVLHSPLFAQHAIILLPPLVLLAGTGFAETVTSLQERRWTWSVVGLAGGLAYLLALPSAIQASRTAQAASFGREADAIILLEQITNPGDNVISDNLLLPFMAGRQTPPPLGDLAQVAIDSGRQSSERLIAISESYPVEAVANWALRLPHLDEYLDWVESNYLVQREWDDHHIIYFGRRVPLGQVPNRVDAQVGDQIELLGYRLASGRHEPSNEGHAASVTPLTLDVTLYWRTGAPVTEDYSVFLHLLDSEGQLIAQHDGRPLYGHLPTGHWLPGDVIPDRHRLSLPADLPTARYRLIAGMYMLETLERLPVRAASIRGIDDNVNLALLEIGEAVQAVQD